MPDLWTSSAELQQELSLQEKTQWLPSTKAHRWKRVKFNGTVILNKSTLYLGEGLQIRWCCIRWRFWDIKLQLVYPVWVSNQRLISCSTQCRVLNQWFFSRSSQFGFVPITQCIILWAIMGHYISCYDIYCFNKG